MFVCTFSPPLILALSIAPMTAQKNTPNPNQSAITPASPKAIIDALPDLVLEIDADGVYLAHHAGREDDLVRRPEELIGRPYREVLPPSVADLLETTSRQAHATGAPQRISYILPINDELRYFDAHISPLDHGGVLIFTRNMTESWRARSELKQSEEQFRALVQNIPGVVYRCEISADWPAVYISDAVEEVYGYPAEDFLSGRQTLGALIHPEDAPRLLPAVQRAVEKNEPFDLNYRIINRFGAIRQLHEHGRPVYNDLNQTDYIDGVIFDVTDMHHMRQRVMINHKMAAVGNLAAGVAHEINNPLAIAMANLDYIHEEVSELSKNGRHDRTIAGALQDIATAIEKIRHGSDRVRTIVEDMRSFSDAAEGKPHKLNPKRIATWAIQRFESRTVNIPKVQTNLDDVDPIWASEVGVVQVIWNLLENAADAVQELPPDQKPSILVRLRQGTTSHILLEVIDNGPGMSDEIAHRAFEPFFTTKPVGQGAGLGLFVCQGLLESMGAEITLDTHPGSGTTVKIRWPILPPS